MNAKAEALAYLRCWLLAKKAEADSLGGNDRKKGKGKSEDQTTAGPSTTLRFAQDHSISFYLWGKQQQVQRLATGT